MAVSIKRRTFAASRGSGGVEYTALDQNPQTIKASSGTLLHIELDNSNNTSRTFVKFYDTAAPVVGTDDPELVWSAPGGACNMILAEEGFAFGTAIVVAAVTEGGTGGTTPPAAPVILRVIYE